MEDRRTRAILIASGLLCCGALMVVIAVYARADDRAMMAEVQAQGPDYVRATVIVSQAFGPDRPWVEHQLGRAVKWVNDQAGLELYAQPGELGLGRGILTVMPYHLEGPFDADERQAYATTTLTFNGGQIVGAVVFLEVPKLRAKDRPDQLARQVLAHELLHGLGLAHDRIQTSIMWPVADRQGQELTARDRQLLHDTYGKGGDE